MKKLILLTSLAMAFVLLAAPALAQELEPQPDTTIDQYGPMAPDSELASEEAVKKIIREGGEADGAAAYEAALNAAREAGANAETAEIVATKVVSEASDKPKTSEGPEITELPDTGGSSLFVLGTGLLGVGAGLLTRRSFS